ncbi:hypothetical protein [Limimaricola cinnabarinus]|uniref:hypothetical protein n=1 Tax=Limimaricola cinnabarinus TaxID=1125964 RepID=UPI002FDFA54C
MTKDEKMPEPQFRPKKRSAAKLLSSEAALPTDDRTYEVRKINEIGELIWMPESLSKSERNARLLRAVELYEGLEPEGAAEGMLAAQMVGTHTAALECLRRAASLGQNDRTRDSNLKNAQKLMTLYAQQMAALNKHRGRGQQKVTVEHVHVHSGGQAIVGTYERQDERKGQGAAPPALENTPEVPLAPQEAPVRSKTRKRS